jgi:glycine/D-amino acid oxidase-like deaminating enzyme
MSAQQILIVGGGIVGTACAAALLRSGHHITLIESDTLGSGATAAGMGQIVALDGSPAELALTAFSQRLWDELTQAQPTLHEHLACGTIWVANDDDELQLAASKLPNYHAAGLAAEIIDARTLATAEPQLRPGLAGGLYIPGDSVVYPARSAVWLWQTVAAAGGVLLRASVRALCPHGVVLADGRTLLADAVIVANGARAIDLDARIPIRAKKGHLAITDRYPGFLRHQVAELGYVKNAHLADVDTVSFNVQPRATGQLLIGSCRQFDQHTRDIDYTMLARMLQRCTAFLPGLAHLTIVRAWTGVRAATPDGNPLIGRHPHIPGVWLATGHEGLGITTALGTAALIRDLIDQHPPALDEAPFDPARLMIPAEVA